MSIYTITTEDVERSSLEPEDVGKSALIIQGCYFLFDTPDEARQAERELNKPADPLDDWLHTYPDEERRL